MFEIIRCGKEIPGKKNHLYSHKISHDPCNKDKHFQPYNTGPVKFEELLTAASQTKNGDSRVTSLHVSYSVSLSFVRQVVAVVYYSYGRN